MMESSSENVDANQDEWPILTQTLYDIQRNIRAPKGFFGMRGKKDFTIAEKRALMGIQVHLKTLHNSQIFVYLTFSYRILMDCVVERDL